MLLDTPYNSRTTGMRVLAGPQGQARRFAVWLHERCAFHEPLTRLR
jgi:hypothetical protein